MQNALPDVLAVIQVALEGSISKRSAQASLAAGQLPQVRPVAGRRPSCPRLHLHSASSVNPGAVLMPGRWLAAHLPPLSSLSARMLPLCAGRPDPLDRGPAVPGQRVSLALGRACGAHCSTPRGAARGVSACRHGLCCDGLFFVSGVALQCTPRCRGQGECRQDLAAAAAWHSFWEGSCLPARRLTAS